MSNENSAQPPSNEELRSMLRSLDPMHPGVPTTPPTRDRLEAIMTTTSTPSTPTRTRWYAVAAAAIVAIAVGAVALFNGLGSPEQTPVAAAPLELSLGAGDSMSSCIVFDVAILADMPIAFEGTVTSVNGDAVSASVDHWYRGGDAATVNLTAPQGMQALIGGIDFVEGNQYLITATDGNVNYCGYTGPATPELRSAFDEAFAA